MLVSTTGYEKIGSVGRDIFFVLKICTRFMLFSQDTMTCYMLNKI